MLQFHEVEFAKLLRSNVEGILGPAVDELVASGDRTVADIVEQLAAAPQLKALSDSVHAQLRVIGNAAAEQWCATRCAHARGQLPVTLACLQPQRRRRRRRRRTWCPAREPARRPRRGRVRIRGCRDRAAVFRQRAVLRA